MNTYERIKNFYYNDEPGKIIREYFDGEDITEAKALLFSLEVLEYDDDDRYIEIQRIAKFNEKLAFQVLILKHINDLCNYVEDVSYNPKKDFPEFVKKDDGWYRHAIKLVKEYGFNFIDALHLCMDEPYDFDELKEKYSQYDTGILKKFWYKDHTDIFFKKKGKNIIVTIVSKLGDVDFEIQDPQDEDDVWEVVNEKCPYDFDNMTQAERELHKLF